MHLFASSFSLHEVALCRFLILIHFLPLLGKADWSSQGSANSPFGTVGIVGAEHCFCQLKGKIDDCTCEVDNVDDYNNRKIYPRLRSLLTKDYFRFYEVNLVRHCPFWEDEKKCGIRNCEVKPCLVTEIPPALREKRQHYTPSFQYSREAQGADCDHDLGALDPTISDVRALDLKRWKDYELSQERFCDVGDEMAHEVAFVDLLKNPERFTGYRGDSAQRIWKSVYEENCFKPEGSSEKRGYLDVFSLKDMCLEKRVFYRVVSGVHTSINIHLCANYPPEGADSPFGPDGMSGTDDWGWNLEEFSRRFGPEFTYGKGPEYLRNLYFLYLIELRALAKASHSLTNRMDFFTGIEGDDEGTRAAVMDLMHVIEEFPHHFDENTMFASHDAARLRNEFREHFLNITRIMDCVGCERCKLWGKLQVHGLGTALKILFSSSSENVKLSRNEVVALFNAFGRLSSSIGHLEDARLMLNEVKAEGGTGRRRRRRK